MKVLIVSSPRTGSTSLLNALSKSLNCQGYDEPFMALRNEPHRFNVFSQDSFKELFGDSCVVKHHAFDKPRSFDGSCIDFMLKLPLHFDRTIFIGRKDFEGQLQSYTYFKEMSPRDWAVKWKWHSSLEEDTFKYRELLKAVNDIQYHCSNWLRIEYDWYEDLFSNDKNKIKAFVNKHSLEDSLNVDEFISLLDNKNKYRIDESNFNF